MAGRTGGWTLFDHTHTRGTTAIVVVFAAVVGLYASWMLADVVPRLLSFVVVAGASSYGLYDLPDRTDVVARGLYALAGLLVLTPLSLLATYLLRPGLVENGSPLALLSPYDLVFVLAFAVIAAVPAGVAFYLRNRGTIKERIVGLVRR